MLQNKEAKILCSSRNSDFASQNKEDYYEQRRERKADDRQDG